MERGLVSDGVIAQNEAQRGQFWAVREAIPEANRLIGAVSSHDVSVPLEALPGFILAASEALVALGEFRINCFGHVGDGNLHFNVFPPEGVSRAGYDPLRRAVMDCVHDVVASLGGSVSAEHGVGRMKVADLERYGDPVGVQMMQGIKGFLDPRGILNPGAVLRR